MYSNRMRSWGEGEGVLLDMYLQVRKDDADGLRISLNELRGAEASKY